MPCHAAMIDKPLTATPDVTVEKLLAKVKKSKQDTVCILDDDGALIGLFSIAILFENLLPVNVTMTGGASMSMILGAAPGLAKRLRKVQPLPVSDLMMRKFHYVSPDAALWEGVKMLMEGKASVAVVDPSSGKFIGLMDGQGALDELSRLQD